MKYLLTSGEDKILKLWGIDDLKLINERSVVSSKIIPELIVKLPENFPKNQLQLLSLVTQKLSLCPISLATYLGGLPLYLSSPSARLTDTQMFIILDFCVYSYPFAYTPLSEDERKDKEKAKPRDALSSHENPSDGQLILGHASPLNAFIFTADEKFIVTADRDEHIRVSWFPKGYNIEMYCLGHLKCVNIFF